MRDVIEGKEVPQDVIHKKTSDAQALFNKANNYRTKVAISDIVEVIGDAKDGSNDNQKQAQSYFR